MQEKFPNYLQMTSSTEKVITPLTNIWENLLELAVCVRMELTGNSTIAVNTYAYFVPISYVGGKK